MFETIKKKSFLTALIVSLVTTVSFAQTDNVGIGTTTPDPSAILDVSNPFSDINGVPSKGMLVPQVTHVQRILMEGQYNDSLANGLLVYEPDDGNFWYYKYDDPIPTTAPFGEWIMISSSTVATNGNVPVGGIIMWSGTIASIEPGWSLCDGSNGTPDLTDKFIVSVASAAENPGTAPVSNEFVEIQSGTPTPPQRRFFKLAYIMRL